MNIASLPPRLPKWQDSHRESLTPGVSCHFPCQNGRIRPAIGTESSGCRFGRSRHFSRQNGGRDQPGSRISGYTAIFPAILRDRGSTDDPSSRTGEKRTQIRTSCPDSANAQTCRLIAEIVQTTVRDSALPNPAGKPQSVPKGQDELKVCEAEARETDKALNKILEKLGV